MIFHASIFHIFIIRFYLIQNIHEIFIIFLCTIEFMNNRHDMIIIIPKYSTHLRAISFRSIIFV